jgi:hypothetical protein
MGYGILTWALGEDLDIMTSIQQAGDLPQNESLGQRWEPADDKRYSHDSM